MMKLSIHKRLNYHLEDGLAKYLNNLFFSAMALNHKNILSLLEKDKSASMIDLGCYDGKYTLELAKKIGTKKIYGIDIVDEKLKKAKKKGVHVYKGDLNKKFPIPSRTMDIVHANQVIEHIVDLDNFVSETHRILKRKGYAVISTENASSWCNIFASIMGWQIFSLTNISVKSLGVGNPFSIHRGITSHPCLHKANLHKTIFNIRGLKELFELYGFTITNIKGSGYFPLPNSFGQMDVRHSHFITLKAIKK